MTIDLSLTALQERLGPVAEAADAEQAWGRAEDWFASTEKQAALTWYHRYRCDNQHAPEIVDEDDGQLVHNWGEIVIFHRAASLADL